MRGVLSTDNDAVKFIEFVMVNNYQMQYYLSVSHITYDGYYRRNQSD